MPDVDFAHHWLALLGKASVEGGATLLLAFALCRCASGLPARLHAWIWRAAYARLFLALLWCGTVDLPLLPAPAPYSASQPALARVPLQADPQEPVGAGAPLHPAAASIPERMRPRPETDFSLLLLALWAAGCAAAALREGGRRRRMRRILTRAVPIMDGPAVAKAEQLSMLLRLRRTPRLLRATGATGPLVTGVRDPVVLLPEELLASEPEALRLALAHELTHVRRGDLLWAWLPLLARTVFFFHPLVWLAEREWHAAVETACDEQVLALPHARPAEYARLLLRVAAQPGLTRHSPGLPALGVVDSLALVRRRLLRMRHVKPLSRAALLRWAGVLAMAGLVGLIPWRVAAQAEAADRSTRLATQWEDVLLLEAKRYLKLTPAQLQKLKPLVQLTEERLARLRAEEEGTVATLERLARKQREALAEGRSVPPGDSEQVVTLGQTLQRRREQTQSEIIQAVAPRLARILTREQIQRAYLLSQGETLPQELKSPPLWDPKAGFIVDWSVASEWRENAVKQALYQRFPPKLVDNLGAGPTILKYSLAAPAAGASANHLQGSIDVLVSDVRLDTADAALRDPVKLREQAPEISQFPEDLRNQAYAEANRLRDRLHNLAQFIPSDASEEERALALQPLVRRVFLSPRLKPALDARLGSPHGE